MLTTNILLAEKYDYLSEKFKKAFTFLRDTDLAALPVGNVPIDWNEVYAHVQSYSTMDAADCPFESHKDRHEKIGEGSIGTEAFERIINHPMLADKPFFLETPNELDGYAKEIALLKSLRRE